jgi:superfamily II DNA or RNA helicase
MVQYTLNKNGFLLQNNESNLEVVKKELIVTPFVKHTYGSAKVESYQLYDIVSKNLRVPKFWAFQKFNITDFVPLSGKKINVEFQGKLRDYQQEVVDKCMPFFESIGGGCLSLPCGDGKTCLAVNFFTRLKVPTLVIVHKSFLMNQWIESIQKFTDAKIGIIQGKTIDIEGKDIVIGMLQSLSMKDYPSELWEKFDFMIVDEVHNVATKVFSKALSKINTRYTLGLSATPERDYKLSKVFYWYLGEMMYVKKKNIDDKVQVRIIFYAPTENASKEDKGKFKESKNVKGELNLPIMLTNISKIKERNNLIIKTISGILAKEPLRNVLLLSSRIEQLEDLKKLFDLQHASISSTFYIGKMKKAQLEEAKQAQVFFATYEMVNEGFDLPKLNTLILATPRSKVEQSVGRILRQKQSSVSPLIIDFVDKIPIYRGQGMKRKKLYKAFNYSVTESTY